MSDLFWLLNFHFTQFKNRLTNPTKETAVKNILIFIFAAMFFPIIYQLFFYIFNHFRSVPIIGGLLVNRLLYAFYMTFSIMTVLSAIVSAIPVLYLSRDMEFLFSSPVSIETIFTVQSAKITMAASWMIVLMAVPIFAAYTTVMKLSAGQYIFILLAHVPFFVILASIGIMLTLLLVRFFPAENVRNIAVAFSGIFVVAFIVYFRMLQPEKLTGASFTEVSQFFDALRAPESPFFPHTHFVNLVKAITASGVYAGLGTFFAQLAVAALASAATIRLSGRYYFEGYGRKNIYRKSKNRYVAAAYKQGTVYAAQTSKDFKYLTRDTSQWIQVVFLAGLVFIYLYNLYKMPAELFNLREFIYFLNIGFIGMVLSAVGARFILPVISNEGKGFWIFKTAPLTMRRYVWYKFLVYGAPVVVLGQVVAAVSIYILRPGTFINIVTIISTFVITLVITAVGTGFGALFANFNIKNPEELITGTAGLAFMFLTFLFVAVMLVIEAGMVREYFMASLVKASRFNAAQYAGRFCIILLIAAAISAGAMEAGIRKIEKAEY
ncbi:MAG: hypothetical protein LLG37_11065 [Spirochaetia bacterium]|nr:hypothetical protein [Spirochaetia bacterium]